MTAIGNDYGFEDVYERQVEAFGNPGDVAIGISTTRQRRERDPWRARGAAPERGDSRYDRTDRRTPARRGRPPRLCSVRLTRHASRKSHILLGHIWSEIVEDALFGHGAT